MNQGSCPVRSCHITQTSPLIGRCGAQCDDTKGGCSAGYACDDATCQCKSQCTANYGQSCISSPNACGQTNTGTYNCNGVCLATTPAISCEACTTLGLTACKNAGCDWDGFVGSATYNKCISASQSCGTSCNPWTSDCTITADKKACCMVNGGTGEVRVPINVF